MTNVVIYTGLACGFCERAKLLLRQKAIDFEEINVALAPERRPEMVERASGRTSVPQIFIDDRHVGGCDELMILELNGELDDLLSGTAA